jgi:hypothetical protein
MGFGKKGRAIRFTPHRADAQMALGAKTAAGKTYG